jgi:hypothetical protein
MTKPRIDGDEDLVELNAEDEAWMIEQYGDPMGREDEFDPECSRGHVAAYKVGRLCVVCGFED